jgi:hypothetical protein
VDQVERSLEDRVNQSLLHINNDIPYANSQVDLPGISNKKVLFVHLNGDKLYLAADTVLYVHYLSDTAPCICTYSLSDECYSGIISENRLYLGGFEYLKIFELTSSLTQPLTPVKEIKIKHGILKVLRVGH